MWSLKTLCNIVYLLVSIELDLTSPLKLLSLFHTFLPRSFTLNADMKIAGFRVEQGCLFLVFENYHPVCFKIFKLCQLLISSLHILI